MSILTKKLFLLFVFLLIGNVFANEEQYLLLQSTTSTKNSGLYEHLLPKFKNTTGIDVRVVAVGTGQALKNARNGDADILLVHAKDREEQFVRDGFGIERFDLMYNDFVIVGPDSDPANINNLLSVRDAFTKIAESKAIFLSRGDNSGTHIKELSLWQAINLEVSHQSGTWYREAGAGMGATLNTAVAMQAYTLTDRSTWISFGNKQNFKIHMQGDPALYNQYGIIIVHPDKHPHVKIELANEFVKWILGSEGQRAIADYTVSGQQLFFPNAKIPDNT